MVAAFTGGVMAMVIKNSIDLQKANAQLGAVLASTGGIAGKTAKDLIATADALELTTTYTAEAVKGAQSLLLTFTKIRGGTFDEATKAVLNMATAMGTDLKSASVLVGKALQDPILGVTALRRTGVQLSAQQTQQVKDFMAVNDIASAQKIILGELTTQFGGSAEAARKTLGGSLTFLKNQFDALFDVSQEGSSAFIDGINAMGEAMIWARGNAVVPFFGGLQLMAIDAAVAIGKLELAQAKLNRVLPGNLIRSAMGKPMIGADVAGAQASLDRLKAAADSMKELPWVFQGPVRPIKALGDEAGETAGKLTALQRALAGGVGAPNMRTDSWSMAADPEVIARYRQAQENLRTGAVQIFDLRPQAKQYKVALDDAVDATRQWKDKALESAMMFRDGFADAIASAVMTGKLSFRSFADFVIAELIRIQARKMFTDVLALFEETPQRAPARYRAPTAPGISLQPMGAPATVVNQTINFSVSAIDSRDAARFVHEQKGTIAGVVAEAARSSGGYRRALAGA